ncbi:MAG: hypothetical protein ABIA92_05260 [Patescibacteria group bacterium]
MHEPKQFEVAGVLRELCRIASETFDVDIEKVPTNTTISGICGNTNGNVHQTAVFVYRVRSEFPMLPRTTSIVSEVHYAAEPDEDILSQLPEEDAGLVVYLQFARQVTLEQLAQLLRERCGMG